MLLEPELKTTVCAKHTGFTIYMQAEQPCGRVCYSVTFENKAIFPKGPFSSLTVATMAALTAIESK